MPKTIYLDFFLSKKIKSETMPSVKGNFQFKLVLPYILKIIFELCTDTKKKETNKNPNKTKQKKNPNQNYISEEQAGTHFLNLQIHSYGKLKGFPVFMNREMNCFFEKMYGNDKISRCNQLDFLFTFRF